MRILHVLPAYYPAVRYGGPIWSVDSLTRALAKRGHEIHVYTTNIDGPEDSDVPLGTPIERDGVTIWYFGSGLGRRLFRAPAMKEVLAANIGRFDLVHLHSVFLWPTMVTARAARRSGIPYLVAPRGMLVADLIRRKSALAKRGWIQLFERTNIEQAAAVHATSEVEVADIKALAFAPKRVVLVPNGVDPAPSTAPADAARRPHVLFLGRINWKKGLDRLIPAMAKVADVDLIVAGNDEENYTPTLVALARESGIADRVHFIGPVDQDRKWQLLSEARLLVLPSYSENFGNVVLESMAAGCPVVVTPEIGMAAVVAREGAGIVSPGHPEALAAAINDLLRDPEMARRMGQAGRDSVRARYGWGTVAGAMEDVYRELLEAEGRQCTN